MPEKFDVTNDVYIEALGPDEAEDPLVYVILDDYPETQIVPIFAREIESFVAALAEAAVWLAGQEEAK